MGKMRDASRRTLTNIVHRGVQIRSGIGQFVDGFVDVGTLSEGVNHISDFVSIVEPLSEKRGPLTIAKVVVGVLQYFIKDADTSLAEEYFDSGDWVSIFSDVTAKVIHETLVLKGDLVKPASQVKAHSDFDKDRSNSHRKEAGAWVGKFPGFDDVSLGWYINMFGECTDIYTRNVEIPWRRAEEILQQMTSEIFWSRRKSKNLMISTVRSEFGSEKKMSIQDDFNRAVYRSVLSDSLLDRCQQFIKAGENRTVMLFGPPGTGKSTAAHRLIHDMDIRSLRIPVEVLHNISNDEMQVIFNIIKPEAVVMDDFDRCHEQDRLLEQLERLRNSVKLVIATVNDLDRLDEAILRPGRFDELIEVDRLDSVAIRNMLGIYADDSFDIVKDWPVAFIEEFIRRRRVMGLDATKVKADMVELAARVRRMRSNHKRGLSFDEEIDLIAGNEPNEPKEVDE